MAAQLLLDFCKFQPSVAYESVAHKKACNCLTLSGLYHIETSPLIYSTNQWTGVYMIGTSLMKEFNATFAGISRFYKQLQLTREVENFFAIACNYTYIHVFTCIH